MVTTLNKIKKHYPLRAESLLEVMNKSQTDDEPLEITTIIGLIGIKNAVWCLRSADDRDKVELFARKVALLNIELIKPYTDNYDLIVQYLETGDDSIRWEAQDAAETAHWGAERAVRAANYSGKSACQVASLAASSVVWATARIDAKGGNAAFDAAWAGKRNNRDPWPQIEQILLDVIEGSEDDL